MHSYEQMGWRTWPHQGVFIRFPEYLWTSTKKYGIVYVTLVTLVYVVRVRVKSIIVHKKSKHIFEHLYYFFLKIYLPAKTQYKTNNYIFKNVLQWNYNLINYLNVIANCHFKPRANCCLHYNKLDRRKSMKVWAHFAERMHNYTIWFLWGKLNLIWINHFVGKSAYVLLFVVHYYCRVVH